MDDAERYDYNQLVLEVGRLTAEGEILKADNKRLRKVAAHVPALDYMRAKEKAGFGRTVSGSHDE